MKGESPAVDDGIARDRAVASATDCDKHGVSVQGKVGDVISSNDVPWNGPAFGGKIQTHQWATWFDRMRFLIWRPFGLVQRRKPILIEELGSGDSRRRVADRHQVNKRLLSGKLVRGGRRRRADSFWN